MILVAGSIHLDILARATGDESAADKIGEVSMEIGGTAGNIARNIARSQGSSRLLTACGRGAYSRLISDQMEIEGVEMVAAVDRSLPMAAFVAHIGKNGELASAVSSMPVERAIFPRETIQSALEGCSCAILDCNLSARSIADICEEARWMGIRCWIAAVSEEKSLRALRAISLGARPRGIFLNRREMEYLKSQGLGAPVRSDEDARAAIGCDLIVTEGPDGATALLASETRKIPSPFRKGDGNTLGAGDAFMAACVPLIEERRMEIPAAAAASMAAAFEATRRENCSLGACDAIDRLIADSREKATLDALTGLLNRGALSERSRRAIEACSARSRPASAIIFDIDHFKSVNDTWGHPAGDAVIRETAASLQGILRESDLAGRWGGEEFVCVLPGADIETAMAVAERIRSKIEATVKSPRQITVSLGAAEAPAGSGLSFEALVRLADEALYVSKKTGRNRASASAGASDSVPMAA